MKATHIFTRNSIHLYISFIYDNDGYPTHVEITSESNDEGFRAKLYSDNKKGDYFHILDVLSLDYHLYKWVKDNTTDKILTILVSELKPLKN